MEERYKLSREILVFAKDLFDYVWDHHVFQTPFSVRVYGDFRSFPIKPCDRNVNSYFNEDIGKAVLNSQYLFREYCYKLYKRVEKGTMYSMYVTPAVCTIVNNWVSHKKNVFMKVIESAAIIAEAILFCDSEGEFYWGTFQANRIFETFFNKKLKSEFLEEGGWEQLQKQVVEKYGYVNYLIEPFISSVNTPYARIPYTCEFIRALRDSPVQYPVDITHFCDKCKVSSDPVHVFKYDKRFLKRCAPSVGKVSELNDREDLKLENFGPDAPITSQYDFICVIVGKAEKRTFKIKKSSL